MASGSSNLVQYCQPIGDQKKCGSCLGWGSTGIWECNLKKLKGENIKLSENYFFCAPGSTCTNGNSELAILEQAKKGCPTEECWPYSPVDKQCGAGRCKSWWLTGKKIQNWVAVTDTEQMKTLLDSEALMGLMAVHQSFVSYVSGVYHSLGNSDPVIGYHCIGIVGYDDTRGAWLIRNSWGTGWGSKCDVGAGYCWIKYGNSEIDNVMFQFVLNGEIPPEPEPQPSPCTVGNLAAKILGFFPWLFHRKGRFYYMNP